MERSCCHVDILSDFPAYEDFYQKYLEGSIPCVFDRMLTSNWPCRKNWLTADGQLDLAAFLSVYSPDTRVPVYPCGSHGSYGRKDVVEMSLGEYLSSLRADPACGYLKDWHFQRAFPGDSSYSTPVYFSSDWLNEYYDTAEGSNDDFRFLYLGPAGSKTPLHEDVLRSFSFSANVVGRKKWVLFPPGIETELYRRKSDLVDISEIDISDVPRAEIVQSPGQVVFVPSGWFHQVWNLEETLSLNHNWINASNIMNTWDLIKQRRRDIAEELLDCRETFTEGEWHSRCELILRADLGMSVSDFCDFIICISRNRIKSQKSDFVFQKDCESLKKVIEALLDEEFRNLVCQKVSDLITLQHSLENQK